MKSGGLLFCLVSGLLGVLGCEVKRMPEGNLVRVELTRSASRAGYEYEGRVDQDSTGAFVLRAMKENYGPLFEKKLDGEVMKRFRQIIEEEKMYKYKERYLPMIKVLDGWSWTFEASFDDGSKIHSHGSNARPKDEGLDRIRQLMEELIQEGASPLSEDEE